MRKIVDLACIIGLLSGELAFIAPAMAQTQSQSRDGRFSTGSSWGNGDDRGWNSGNNGQTVRCESRRNNYVECRVDTRGGVRISRVIGGNCQQDQSWGWRDGLIWVNRGCRAEFQTGGFGGGSGGNWNGGGASGNIVRCESWNFQYAECRADTRGGVRVSRVLGGSCPEGRNWGTRGNVIWVNNGCRADFQLLNGNGNNGSSNGGNNTALIIGGVVVAAGLAAIIASSSKKPASAPAAGSGSAGTAPPLPTTPPANAGRPARINVPTGGVTPDARPSLTTCLTEIARQIGATGGTEIGLDRFDDVIAGNGGFRFRMVLKAIYPDEIRSIPVFCRATPTAIIELSFG